MAKEKLEDTVVFLLSLLQKTKSFTQIQKLNKENLL
jgi:hypothetical protein